MSDEVEDTYTPKKAAVKSKAAKSSVSVPRLTPLDRQIQMQVPTASEVRKRYLERFEAEKTKFKEAVLENFWNGINSGQGVILLTSSLKFAWQKRLLEELFLTEKQGYELGYSTNLDEEGSCARLHVPGLPDMSSRFTP